MSTQQQPSTEQCIVHIINDIVNENDSISRRRVESLTETFFENQDAVPEPSINEIQDVIDSDTVTLSNNGLMNDVMSVDPVTKRPDELPKYTTPNADTTTSTTTDLEYEINISTIDETDDSDFTELLDLQDNRAEILANHFDTFEQLANADSGEITNLPTFNNQTEADQLIKKASLNVNGIIQTANEAHERESDYFSEQVGTHGINKANSWKAADVDKPAGKPSNKHFHGLPILEDTDHPFITDIDDLPPLYTRPVGVDDNSLDDERDEDEIEQDIELIARLLAKNNYIINLIGHSGTAKSLRAEYIAAIRNQPSFGINMDGSMISEDLFGIHHLEDERGNKISDDKAEEILNEDSEIEVSDVQTVWKDGPITRAVRYGWLLWIDEINGAPPTVLLALHALFERDGNLHIKENNEVIEPHEQFRLITTMNPPNSGYNGTSEMNNAFANRMIPIVIDFLPKEKEVQLIDDIVNRSRPILARKQIEDLVDLANRLRDEAETDIQCPRWSPRDILKVADLYDSPKQSLRGAARILLKGQTPQETQQTESYLEFANNNIDAEY